MTCIVGIAKDGRVYVGADSCGSDGYSKHTHNRPKVFTVGDFIIGYTSSFRMGQIIEHQWTPPARDEGNTDYDYLVKQVIPSLMQLFKRQKYGTEENGEQEGGTFIIGYKGKCYYIQNDFAVLEPADGFYAVGSGTKWALGSLYSTKGEKDIEKRINLAIEAAEHYSCTVQGPVVIETIED